MPRHFAIEYRGMDTIRRTVVTEAKDSDHAYDKLRAYVAQVSPSASIQGTAYEVEFLGPDPSEVLAHCADTLRHVSESVAHDLLNRASSAKEAIAFNTTPTQWLLSLEAYINSVKASHDRLELRVRTLEGNEP